MTIVSLDPGDRRSCSSACPDREGRSGRVVELRLLGDERADLREPPRDRRRRRLRVRRARLRDGVPHAISRRPGRTRSGRSRRPAPSGGSTARSSAAASSGRRRRSTRRRTRSTSAPAPRRRSYYPSLRPGSNPRADSLIAVNLATGQHEVVAAADGAQRVVVRHLAAAARLHGEDRRQDASAIVSVGDDGGRLVRLRRGDRPADLPARQGDRPHRASDAASPASRSSVYPSSLGGLNYSPASFDPQHELHLQRRRRDRVGRDAGAADADAEEAQASRSATSSSGSRTATSAQYLPRLARLRLDQRDRRQHRQARVEVHDAAAGARRRHDDRQRRSASPAAATASCARST